MKTLLLVLALLLLAACSYTTEGNVGNTPFPLWLPIHNGVSYQVFSNKADCELFGSYIVRVDSGFSDYRCKLTWLSLPIPNTWDWSQKKDTAAVKSYLKRK